MKTILLSLMLLLSTTIFSNPTNSTNSKNSKKLTNSKNPTNKIWIDIGGFFAPTTQMKGASLNFVKDSLHYKLKVGSEHFGDDNYTIFNHLDILIGKQLPISKHVKFSALVGLGIISIEKADYDLDQNEERFFKTISIPLELEFMAHLKHVGLGINFYTEINKEKQLVGFNIKIAFGNM